MTLSRTEDHSNAKEMKAQPFYRYMQKTYSWHILLSFALLYAFGGLPAMIWGGCVRTCIVWHITWSINSFCHIYGKQSYDTRTVQEQLVLHLLAGRGLVTTTMPSSTLRGTA